MTATAVLLAAGLLRRSPERPPRRLLWPAAAWLAGLGISFALGGSSQPASLLPPLLGTAALFVGWQLRRAPDAAVAMAGIGAGAVAASLHAAAQHAGWDPVPRADFFPDRVVGPFANPNHLAGFLAAALPLLLTAGLGAGSSPGGVRWRPALGLGLAVLLILGVLLLAGSRGALAGCLAGTTVVFAGYVRGARLRRLRARPLGWLPLLLGAAGVALLLRHEPVMSDRLGETSVSQRLQAMLNVAGDEADRDATLVHRRVLRSLAWRMFAADPWLGAGPGQFRTAGVLADEAETRLLATVRGGMPRHAHNELLQTAAESGLAGLLPLVVLLAAGGLGALGPAWRTGDPVTWAALGGCAAVMVHGLVSYPLHLPATAGVFWVLLGVLFRRAEPRGAGARSA
ncbi:MAG: O-antigen ligase family protein [Gemmatimonadaceae bacterium]|nr:O-antigen ligase family protein [Gemmatimonadaceae bacterium]